MALGGSRGVPPALVLQEVDGGHADTRADVGRPGANPPDVGDAEAGHDEGQVPAWRTVTDLRVLRAAVRPAPRLRRTMLVFAAGNLVPLLVLLVAVTWLTREVAGEEALRGPRAATDLLAEAVVEPVLRDSLLDGDPEARRELDQVVREHVLVEPRVRVKLWTRDGQIVYSDEPLLIGDRGDLSAEQLAAMDEGRTVAELSGGTGAENRFERDMGQLLEVYRPVDTPGGERLLFETYSRYEQHTDRRTELWARFLPIAVAGVVLFPLCQVPLVWSLVRRLRAGQEERERLLVRASHASEAERRRIAADIHDTVVQSLVGAGFVVAGTADDLERSGERAAARRLHAAAGAVRESVRGLRSMLVQVYPPDLARAGLPAALGDLLGQASAQGLVVRADVPHTVDLPVPAEALLFRVAQEALRNTLRHASASSVSLQVRARPGGVVLEVADDGVGFDLDEALARGDGHVGLRVIRDLVAEAGGGLAVSTAPGRGTRVRVEVRA